MRPTIPTTRCHRSDEWPDSGVRRGGPVPCRARGCPETTSGGKPFCVDHSHCGDYAMAVAVGAEIERAQERLAKLRSKRHGERKRRARKGAA